jgi:hypothetical protein
VRENVTKKIFNKDIILSVILQPAKNLDLKDVILSVSEESPFFSIYKRRDPSAFGFRMTKKQKF